MGNHFSSMTTLKMAITVTVMTRLIEMKMKMTLIIIMTMMMVMVMTTMGDFLYHTSYRKNAAKLPCLIPVESSDWVDCVVRICDNMILGRTCYEGFSVQGGTTPVL
jgi:hypothetical protein